MLRTLQDRRDWELLDAIVDGTVTVGEVFDHYTRDGLPQIRAKLNDVDLATYIQPWQAALENRLPPGSATPRKYLVQLRFLIPEGTTLLRSEVGRHMIVDAIDRLSEGRSGPTQRRYVAAWSSFFVYLVEREILDRNPTRGLRLPSPNPPREAWIPVSTSLRLVEAHAQPYRALTALREGAGVEISACLRVRRRDIDADQRLVHVHGTKNRHRDRFVRVDEWAWPHFYEHARQFLPNALLWPDVTADMARHYHRQACSAIELSDYRMHDARHSYAVRHMKEGDDPFLIANNLGHRDASMVLKVYGKYRPSPADFRRLSGGKGA